jgi:hypothetical protein
MQITDTLWKQLQKQLSFSKMCEASAQLSLLVQNHPEFEKTAPLLNGNGVLIFLQKSTPCHLL